MRTRPRLDKAAVIAAAAEIADRHGSENLTLTVLAEHLGIRSPSLYAHVDGLEGLRADLLVHYTAMMADKLRRAAVGLAGPDAVIAIGRAFAAFFIEHPGSFGLTTEQTKSDPRVVALMFDAGEPLLKVLRTFRLTRTQRRQWLRIIWSSIYGLSYARYTWQIKIDGDLDEVLEVMLTSFVESLEQLRGSEPVALRPTKALKATRRTSARGTAERAAAAEAGL